MMMAVLGKLLALVVVVVLCLQQPLQHQAAAAASSTTAAPGGCDEFMQAADAAVAAAETACGTSRLEVLARGDSFHGGSESFCVASCINAINALLRTYDNRTACTSSTDEDYRVYQRIQTEQRECNPPRDECVSVYFEYLFFLQSTQGQQCLAEMAAARALTASDHQAAYHAICSGDCFTQLSGFATRLQDAGCRPWPAYLELQRNLDLLCSKADDTYCEPGYIAAASDIAVARDTSRSVSERTSTLSTICTPCFNEIQSIEGRYKGALGLENGEGNLCTQVDDTYCLPILDDLENTVSLTSGEVGRSSSIYAVAVNEIVDDLGCCFHAMEALHTALTATPDATSNLFARLSFLSDSCCARQRSACQTTFDPSCDHQDQTETLSVTIASPPFAWIRDNQDLFNTAFVADISATLGVLQSSVTVTGFQQVSQGVTVSFQVASETTTRLQKIEAELTGVIARDSLSLWNTAAAYTTRCDSTCTSDATHTAASGLVILTILLFTNLTFIL
ncbi:hypothetical protein PTSG_03435 [Salpingoeca rosetta]|uniref:Uncharacterized protein n=1 Tax=Salpingoeca rosetta (strain ATCC 50818 / BSB-021) TaxID=946362 RepID=F2U569_SALR5|nr:uncharacterized protein PTSG_03435 [Salpingoeca rosetta]EGD82785.1 hypothetical protein PTSG_03435 [Salpingoeca rosetta]|eukprot:XP_004996021.1 hypothetical protein PTSG_03435 [Salpingoeca rosetta]